MTHKDALPRSGNRCKAKIESKPLIQSSASRLCDDSPAREPVTITTSNEDVHVAHSEDSQRSRQSQKVNVGWWVAISVSFAVASLMLPHLVFASKRADLARLGSFMTKSDAIMHLFDPASAVGFVALVIVVLAIRAITLKIDRNYAASTFWKMLGMSAALSLICVLLFQQFANYTWHVVFDDGVGGADRHVVASMLHSKAGVLVLIVTFFIGGAYAFTGVEATLPVHLFAYICGVGLLEEGCKCAAVLILSKKASGRPQGQQSLGSFIVAGLGFGVGESIQYFSSYNQEGADLATYLMRACWCVPLHVAWTTVAGIRVLKAREQSGASDSGALRWRQLLSCLAPSMALHGIYDAYTLHDGQMCQIVGVASFAMAAFIIARYLGNRPTLVG